MSSKMDMTNFSQNIHDKWIVHKDNILISRILDIYVSWKSRKIIIVCSIIMAMREQSKKHELMSKKKWEEISKLIKKIVKQHTFRCFFFPIFLVIGSLASSFCSTILSYIEWWIVTPLSWLLAITYSRIKSKTFKFVIKQITKDLFLFLFLFLALFFGLSKQINGHKTKRWTSSLSCNII